MVIGCLVFLLLSATVAGVIIHRSDRERIRELESLVGELRNQQKKTMVSSRVSKQMEKIAYGQQVLSEERSQEAVRQSEIAQAATLRSEMERRKAVQAKAAAEYSAQEAQESYQMAERQRKEANEQRRQAEKAKMTADTLNYISLGRTLGSLSYSIYRTGDTEMGNMLAYASYLYTHDYGGNLYSSSIFPALTQSSGGKQSWSVHEGSISGVDFFPNGKQLLTVSTHGEMTISELHQGKLNSRSLFRNKNYCFRDAFASMSGRSYAISHTGHLVVAGGGKAKIIPLDFLTRPFRMEIMVRDRQLLIIGERNLALLDLDNDKIVTSRQLDFNVVCAWRRDNKPLLFDDRGRMHAVNSIDDMTDEKVPVSGKVTSFASNPKEGLAAYGTSDGTIYLTDRQGRIHRLVGHLSQVTKLKFNGRRLYSSSYDRKLLFWVIGENQNKPITLLQANSWLADFTFDEPQNCIWTGESNGMVTECLISLPLISQRLRNNIKRDFTRDEWDYYVGKGIPYRKLKTKK